MVKRKYFGSGGLLSKMANEPNLFSIETKKAIDKLTVTTTQRVVTDFWIEINGRKFDAEDVYTTLIECCEHFGAYIANPKMVEALKSLHVIEHGGSGRWAMSAAKGPNYDQFMKRLERQLRKLGSDHF